MRKNSCYTKYDWLDIFPEPIKFRVTSQIGIRRHYEKGLFVWPFQNKSTFHTNIILNYISLSYKDRIGHFERCFMPSKGHAKNKNSRN